VCRLGIDLAGRLADRLDVEAAVVRRVHQHERRPPVLADQSVIPCRRVVLKAADLSQGPAAEALLRLVRISWETFEAQPFLLNMARRPTRTASTSGTCRSSACSKN
jgi:hypothetical protein